MNEFEKFKEFTTLYYRRDNYQNEINELVSKGNSITDSELVKLLALTKTADWYDNHIYTLENGGYGTAKPWLALKKN